MDIINQLSIAVAIGMFLMTTTYVFRVRNTQDDFEAKLLLMLVFMVGALASSFASALAIAIEGFWLYSVLMGLVIFALTYASYNIRCSWED